MKHLILAGALGGVYAICRYGKEIQTTHVIDPEWTSPAPDFAQLHTCGTLLRVNDMRAHRK